MNGKIIDACLSLIGAAAGGAVGFFAFGWLLRQGYYAMVLPGAMVGIGCGLLSRRDSLVRGILCGLAGLALGLFCEWKHAPFNADGGFVFFIKHLDQLNTPQVTLGLIGLSGVISFYVGKGRLVARGPTTPRPSVADAPKKNETT